MAWKRLKIVLDADDVLLDCNGYALELLNQSDGTQHSLEEITGWGTLGKGVDQRFRFFAQNKFYQAQPPLPGAQVFLQRLMLKAEVLIMTAVYPEHMGDRISRLVELFPFFPADHIIMGKRKDVIHADLMLDDSLDNLASCDCDLPVLFSRPWNYSATGVCRVQSHQDFLTLVDILNGDRQTSLLYPKIVCIVGPSGSGKQELATELCKNPDFERVKTLTTSNSSRAGSIITDANQFDQALKSGELLESTFYAGERYGTMAGDLDRILSLGKHAVCVLDISGCLSVLQAYPKQCRIFFSDRDKRECLLSLLAKPGLDRNQLADRILACDLEQKNKVLADEIIPVGGPGSIQEAANLIRQAVEKGR